MRIIQFRGKAGSKTAGRGVGVVAGDGTVARVNGPESVYDLAVQAIAKGQSLAKTIEAAGLGDAVDYEALIAEGRLLPPLDHPEQSRFWVTGTGLTHLGSADARDQMHKKAETEGEEALSDSMRMFKWGLEGGKPEDGKEGVQPEWFYKGTGACITAPGKDFTLPDFSLDGGEEPELAALYVNGPDGQPYRVGFALGNEFSDHVMERQNYLYLAHSKLRSCSFGPELLLGEAPQDIRGQARILRGDKVLWEKEFRTGEANMSHTLANLEHHHFKYSLFRRPGDAHCHFFGTATLSFTDGIKAEPGDIFEIAAEPFGKPLRNGMALEDAPDGTVKVL